MWLWGNAPLSHFRGKGGPLQIEWDDPHATRLLLSTFTFYRKTLESRRRRIFVILTFLFFSVSVSWCNSTVAAIQELSIYVHGDFCLNGSAARCAVQIQRWQKEDKAGGGEHRGRGGGRDVGALMAPWWSEEWHHSRNCRKRTNTDRGRERPGHTPRCLWQTANTREPQDDESRPNVPDFTAQLKHGRNDKSRTKMLPTVQGEGN